MDANVIIYSAVTLVGLYALADWLAPVLPEPDTACRVGYVYDGDTVEMLCGGEKLTARLVGYDTPETRGARCPEELALGKRATARLRELVGQGQQVALFRLGYGKYGRDLVRMEIDGRDVAGQMVEEGLAVSYRGGSRIDWCARIGGGDG